LDRQEMATEGGQDLPYSAVQYMRRELGLQVCCIAKLDDLMSFLQAQGAANALAAHLPRVQDYRRRYGVND
ncbi:MAG: orotate phosphoribosyltransferase, partial [Hylemonella sp.]